MCALRLWNWSAKKNPKKSKNMLTNSGSHSIIPLAWLYGGIAQLARAFGSYPKCRWFKSDCRYHFFGPVVKRLRHRPFTAVTRVRFSSGSPKSRPKHRDFGFIWSVFLFGRIAQLVRAFASHARGHGFESPCVHHLEKPLKQRLFLCLCGLQRFLKAKIYFWNNIIIS